MNNFLSAEGIIIIPSSQDESFPFPLSFTPFIREEERVQQTSHEILRSFCHVDAGYFVRGGHGPFHNHGHVAYPCPRGSEPMVLPGDHRLQRWLSS